MLIADLPSSFSFLKRLVILQPFNPYPSNVSIEHLKRVNICYDNATFFTAYEKRRKLILYFKCCNNKQLLVFSRHPGMDRSILFND